MEYFWSEGGNNLPYFTYRYLIKEMTEGMHHWCTNYPLNGPFQRWHVIRNYFEGTAFRGDAPETQLIQFEDRKAAFLFSIAFSEYIIADKTMKEYK